jgi:hypothetical protein
MDGQPRWIPLVTLVVAGATLAVAIAIAIRPGVPAPSTSGADMRALEAEIDLLRDDIAALRLLAERSSPAPSVDLSSIENRLAGLEGSMATMGQAVDAMNATARTICQMVADSPFTPATAC